LMAPIPGWLPFCGCGCSCHTACARPPTPHPHVHTPMPPAGGPLTVVELDASAPGHVRTTVVGRDLAAGQKLQHVVPPNTWFGAVPGDASAGPPASGAEGTDFSLVGCTVAPGGAWMDVLLVQRRAWQQQLQRQQWVVSWHSAVLAPTLPGQRQCGQLEWPRWGTMQHRRTAGGSAAGWLAGASGATHCITTFRRSCLLARPN